MNIHTKWTSAFQFHQFGVEMIGYESPYLDVECMTMAVTLVEALGLKGLSYILYTW